MNIIKKWASKFGSGIDAEAYARGLFSLHQNQILAAAALALKTTSSPLAKNTNQVIANVNGQPVKLAASDLPALTGVNIATGSKAIVGFTVDVAGNLAVTQGNAATTFGGMTWPARGENTVTIGYAMIENATGSAFVGGTTALDTSNLTVTYINSSGSGIDPLSIF